MVIKILPPLPKSVNAGKIPTWQLNRLVHRNCPVCNSDNPNPIVVRPDKLTVCICQNCSMIYIPDIPNMEEIEKFYNAYSDFKGLKKPNLKYNLFKRWIATKNNFFIHILEETGGIKGLKICEIGCSFGDFLELLRYKGGDTYGVEIDNNCLELLKERGFLCSKEIDLSQMYDIVCMLQLLEHIINPSELISKVANISCPDGRVLISVPNAGEYYKIGPSWIGFRVDLEHINYWSLHSLAKLLMEHGLIIEHFWEHKQPAIQRTTNVNDVPLVIRFINSIIKRFLNFDIMNIGTFVLTVLARKF